MISVYGVRVTLPDGSIAERSGDDAYNDVTISWTGKRTKNARKTTSLFFSGDIRHVEDWAAENELKYEEFRFDVDLDARKTANWRTA